MRTICIALIIVYAAALPSIDDMLPESPGEAVDQIFLSIPIAEEGSSDSDSWTNDDELEAAKWSIKADPHTIHDVNDNEKWKQAHGDAIETISLMQMTARADGVDKLGEDCDGCGETLVKEVKDSVETDQKILDTLDHGHTCKTKGLTVYNQAKARKTKVDQDLGNAKHQVDIATSAQVKFAKQTFSSIQEGQCSPFFGDIAYITAKARYTRTVKIRTQQEGKLRDAVKWVRDTHEAHVKAVLSCRCAVKSAMETAWHNANAGNAEDDTAWHKAHHVLCVLKETPLSQCKVPAVPRVRRTSLADDIESTACQSTCPPEKGFCVKSNGGDQNSGVVKIDSGRNYGTSNNERQDCLRLCKARKDATGCEVIWDQSNRGCYAHTQAITRGNGVARHLCWVFSSKCNSEEAEINLAEIPTEDTPTEQEIQPDEDNEIQPDEDNEAEYERHQMQAAQEEDSQENLIQEREEASTDIAQDDETEDERESEERNTADGKKMLELTSPGPMMS